MSDIPGHADALAESALDMARCAAIGRELMAERTARGLTVDQVAHDLLLSRRQVQSLEQPDIRAFYAPIYFLRALQKYCELLGIALDAHGPAVVEPSPAHAVPAGGDRRWAVPLVLALAFAGAVVAGGYWYAQSILEPVGEVAVTAAPAERAASPEPIAAVPAPDEDAALEETPAVDMPAAEPPASPPPVTPPPAPSVAGDVATAPAARGAGSVTVDRATWVFIRYADNSVVERAVGPGQSVVFDALPIYLAVGTPRMTLAIGARTVNLAPYTANGQVRLTREDLMALANQRE